MLIKIVGEGYAVIVTFGMQGKKDYQEKLFLSFQLSNHVPADNFYRRLKGVLDLQWLYKATQKYYGTEGQKSVDLVVFFKLILVGYLENLNSDRKIIEHSRLRLDILFFLGYDLDEELPWHSTISRTRGLFGEEVFKALFKQVLSLCIQKGMLSGKRQAIDSAFVKANASMDSLAEKQIIEDGEYYLSELQHDQYGNAIEQHENVMEDNRDSDTITRSRNKSTQRSITAGRQNSTRVGRVVMMSAVSTSRTIPTIPPLTAMQGCR